MDQPLTPIDLEIVRDGLRRLEPAPLPDTDGQGRRASVALVFSGAPRDLSLCLIRRATREGDPWSGQMALPGGRVDATDPTRRAAAEREAHEEVGLDLSGAEFLGPLREFPMYGKNGVLSPFAYYVGGTPAPLVPEEAEVDAAFWLSVSEIWSAQRKTTIDYTHEGTPMRFPGISFPPDVIWGLTYRVLTDLGRVIDRPLGRPAW